MIVIWATIGPLCGALSLFLRLIGKDYGNLVTGLLAWALFGIVMIFVTGKKNKLLQLVGGSAIVGTLLMALAMLLAGIVDLFPAGKMLSQSLIFASIARALGGLLTGIALYYLWQIDEASLRKKREPS